MLQKVIFVVGPLEIHVVLNIINEIGVLVLHVIESSQSRKKPLKHFVIGFLFKYSAYFIDHVQKLTNYDRK